MSEELLELVKDWEDPWPDPVIQDYDGIKVVRDDLLTAGSKIRFIDYYICHYLGCLLLTVYVLCFYDFDKLLIDFSVKLKTVYISY